MEENLDVNVKNYIKLLFIVTSRNNKLEKVLPIVQKVLQY